MKKVGNKAKNLKILKDAGFAVPNFIVFSPDDMCKTKKIKEELRRFVRSNKSYAVRSSGTLEDTADLSFAGQYHTALNVSGVENIYKAIKHCCESVGSQTVAAYLENNNITTNELEMAVIVQEMVEPDSSGVAFSINPLGGSDKEIVINVAKGLGDAVVGGQVVPEEYIYNWYDKEILKDGDILESKLLVELAEVALKIQVLFGYPVDIEFAIKDGKIFLLQARAITKVLYESIPDQWTTADFKDGGVSATVCIPFMWSLYEYIWEIAYRDFLENDFFLNKKLISKLSEMHFGRPYWNLTKTKLGMEKVPGYKEREFDNDLGIKPTYDGDGVTTGLTPKSLLSGIRILLRNKEQIKNRLENNQDYHEKLLRTYKKRLDSISDNGVVWQKLVFCDYLLSESTYFEQIFINTVSQSIFKDELLKRISKEDYLKLLMGLNDVSHLRPYQTIWELSRKDKVTSADIADFIEQFGYHSDKELDVTYPHFAEDTTKVKQMIAEAAKLSDNEGPLANQASQNKLYESIFENLSPKMQNTVAKMRKLLWWREEFRDISTRFYYLIRLYTLELAKKYKKEKIIKKVDDIWFLKISDISSFIDGKLSQNDLADIIEKNRTYYNSFRNYQPENEIGKSFDSAGDNSSSANQPGVLTGIGCSAGVVTGQARVVRDLSEIDTIKPGEILITKYTDTGWTSKFAIIGGIVTEYGGVLCHAAIVSREFGIPCVVCAEGAMGIIKDGDTITIDGATGSIRRDE